MSQAILTSMTQNMDKTLQNLKTELTKIRTGRASANLLDPVVVDYYGSPSPVGQIAAITTPDARTIQVAPWEGSMLGAIEKAILVANIGLTPQNNGKVILINVPVMTEERRKEMVKLIKKMGEDSKVVMRNSRREANDEVKKAEKAKSMSEDEAKKFLETVQKKTDDKIAEADKMILAKEKEIITL